MELQDYVAILRKRWLTVLLAAVLTTAAAIAYTMLATPIYSAHAQVYVSVRAGDTTAELLQGSSFTQSQVKSYTNLATSPRVLDPVIRHLELDTTPEQLEPMIHASAPLDTSLISLRVNHPDPVLASDIANAVAFSLAEEVADLERSGIDSSPVRISTVRNATPPASPSSPSMTRNVALGLLLGLAAGFGLAVLRQVLDTRVRTTDDVRALSTASVLTTMPHDEATEATPVVVLADPHGARAEAFRRLRTNLQFLDVADSLASLVVTSSLPGEGKSTVAANLAVTLAEAGSRVLLVDADLRRPSVAEYLGLEGGAGLTTVLIGRASIEDVVQAWGPTNLSVLTTGQVPPNPSEMLGSAAMARIVADLTKRYDVVVFDTPPLLPVTDAAILARVTDGAIVVAGANRLHRHDFTEALGSLDAVGARTLGVVVNHLERKQGDAYAYEYYGSTAPVRR